MQIPVKAARRLVGRLAGTVLLCAAAAVATAPPAAAAPGDKTLDPFVDCYFDNGDGTVTYSVGVTSSNAGTVTVPVGADNEVDTAPGGNLGQPTSFLPGTHSNVWAPTLADDAKAKWNLSGNKVNLDSKTLCASQPVPAEGNTLAVVAFGALVTAAGSYLLSGHRRRRGLPEVS